MAGAPRKKAMTKAQMRLVEANEAKARSLIADIVPLLREIPEEAMESVAERLEAALAVAKRALNGEATK